VIQEGSIGGEQGRFAYLDAEHDHGIVIEISDISGPKGRHRFDPGTPIRIEYPNPIEFPTTPTTDPPTTRWKTKR
jgi:hypothetical protein